MHDGYNSPVYRVPQEVLAEIFFILQNEELPQYHVRQVVKTQGGFRIVDGRSHTFQILGWIRVTHVCHLWREVALDHASLWATIHWSLCSDKWNEELLLRSKDAPLSLIFQEQPLTSPKEDRIIPKSIFSDHHPRLRHLTVDIDDDAMILNLTKQPMPALESFAVLCASFRHQPLILPRSLFGSHAPLLRKLKLNNCYVPWDSTIYDRLISLRLFESHFGAEFKTRNLQDLLSRMHTLQTLLIQSAFPSDLSLPPNLSDIGPTSAFIAPFSLKNFKALAVSETDIDSCIALVMHLVVSPSSSIHIMLPVLHNKASRLSLIMHFMERQAHQHAPPRSLAVSTPPRGFRTRFAFGHPETSCGTCASCEPYEVEVLLILPPVSHDGSTSSSSPPTLIDNEASKRFFGGCVGNLTQADLDVAEFLLTPECWLAFFRNACQLRVLRASEETLFHILRYLAMDTTVPLLEEIEVFGREMGTRLDIGALIDCLKVRKERGCPVREACLPDRFRAMAREELENVVDVVEFR